MNMEIDKSVNNVTISRTMIESLLGVIQSKNIRNLENVLDMITKNLMFDDPGLFDVKLIAEPHERQMQQTVNIWLINQMLHLLLQPECERLATNVLNLQTEMLAASYLKQPWFFEKLLLIYIEFTAILANATAISSNQPFITKLFTIDNINLNAIVENCEFSKIEITTERQQLNLAVNNIKLLTNVIPLIDQINENLLRKATESVMSAFNRSTPHIKVECLQYFVRTWKQHRCLNRENFQLLVGYILEGIEKIIQVLKPPQVIQLLVIERDNFLINSGKWFNEFDASIDAVTEHLITKNLNTFLSLIKVLDKIENIKMVQFQCSLFKFIKKLLKKCGTQQHIMRIQSHISSNELNGPSLILLEFFILNNLTKFNEAEILGYGLFNELMGKCLTLIKDSLYEEEIEQNLTLMKSIIEMANTIDHDFQHWHQNQHIKNQCQLCQTTSSITTTINIGTINIIMKTISPLASLQVDEFTKRFVDILTQHRYLKSPHIPQITGIAIQLLCLGSVQQFTENTKLSLLKITLATLCNRSESSLKHVHSIFSNSILTKDTLFDPARLVDNLESFININIMGMSLDNKNFIQEHILNVTENVNILWKIRLKFLLADSHFNRDLCAFLFERNMNENNANLIAKSHLIKATVCALSTVVYEVRSRTKTHYYDQLICHQCFNETLFQRNDCVISKYTIQNPDTFTSNMDSIFKLFKCTNTEVRLNMIQWIAGLANHCPNIICQNDNLTYWTDLFLDEDTNILNSLASNIEAILEGIENTNIDRATKNLIILDCLKKLSQQIRKSIDDKHEQRQKCLLRILTKIATTSGFKLNDELLLNCIRCTCVFIMVVNSYVARHSAQAIEDMCVANGVSARDLLNWHSQTMLKHLVTLAVITFMRYGYGLEKSFFIVSTAFNYKNARDFLSNNFPTIIGMILAWRIKHTECQELLDEICTLINYDASTIFTKSFLSIYTYVHFNESSSIKDQCIKFICATTKKTVCQHLKQDIRKTLAEILIYYNRNPEFVMKTCKMIIGNDAENQDVPMVRIAEYIAARFLGVLTHFGTILILGDIEKQLQKETLLSLGDVIRFMGTEHITHLRFKILAVLKSALALATYQSELQDICAKVFKIFIFTVDVQSLGSLLSTIVVSLEPLFATHPQEVNEILKFLIISNGNLLSIHISDLFFIDETKASNDIKQFISQHPESIRAAENFQSKFRLYSKNANHDNLNVRIYSLRYLTQLFEKHRKDLNDLIIGQPEICSTIADLLNNLMMGCKHIDENLQLISGQCLGQMGAIEPSCLPPNYAQQKTCASSIHTDEFAIMALSELCRAFQFQKDSKYVDGYSLAIQEIFVSRGVNPKQQRKMNIWLSIPEKLRPLMEPFLTSCYTNITSGGKQLPHPVYGSTKCSSSEQWGFFLASNLIEWINIDENTKHLLKSFKSSMKNDANILTTFLPYILIHSLQNCSDSNSVKIYTEFECVFKAVLNQMETTKFKADVNEMDISVKCAKLAFNQFDYLDRWLRQYSKTLAAQNANYKKIEQFLQKFEKKMIAKVNFACGEYARALMHLESYIEENPKQRLQEELSFLSQIYGELMDSDSLEGVLSLKKENLSLQEQILLNTAVGRLQDSTVCFEKIIQNGDISEINVINMIQCYLGLDQPETALLVSKSLMAKMNDQNMDLLLQGCAEPLWRMSRFEELDKFLECNQLRDNNTWGIRYGQALLSFRKHDDNNFFAEINKCRMSVLKQFQLTSDEQSSYNKSYSLVLKLHLISEIECAHQAVNQLKKFRKIEECKAYMNDLFNDWNARLEIMQPTAKIIEPILCHRRIILSEMKKLSQTILPHFKTKEIIEELIDRYIGQSLMKSIELARNAENFHQAQLFILNAEEYRKQDLFLEKAKVFWKKSDQANSLKTLERGIETILKGHKDTKLLSEHEQIVGEAKFLIATYNAESMNTSHELNTKYFKAAVEALPSSEKCLVNFAQYLEKIFSAMTPMEQASSKGNQCQLDIMSYYGKSMLFGCRYMYQSMPRVLSVWLDFTAKTKIDKNEQAIAKEMNRFAAQFCSSLPSFMFFATFSQLVSRICHPEIEVYNILKTIIIKLIVDFPQHSLWMILSVYKSSYANRVRRCTEIFSDKRIAKKDIQTLIKHFNDLAELFIELTNKELQPSQTSLSISNIIPRLPMLFKGKDFSPILLPTEKLMQPVMPTGNLHDKPTTNFNAFPNTAVYIHSVKDELIVLSSLQRPKHVTIIGTDGKQYGLLMKPKDDLRRDFRLMEFNAVVKQYLRQDAEARHRRLGIRTYAVIPLNEECGILEWIPNLQAFRTILNGYYKARNLGNLNRRDIAEVQSIQRENLEVKRNFFLKKLLPRHPPIFGEWFRDRFTTPHNWYQARSSYIRKMAVMSIVGYILGLGDRHGENILLDTTNGDIIHVDFNCLFNKGEQFEIPELVPFRLTHNMIHAMGACGVEGLYRKCCEITMKVMQEQTHPLMAVLKPFVYDPLVTWNRSIRDSKAEKTDGQAMANVKRIEERLKGFIKVNGVISSMPLSTDGVVNHCIIEARDLDNLARMYVGWSAFL